MDTGPHENQDAMIEDTLMEMGQAPVATSTMAAAFVPDHPDHAHHAMQDTDTDLPVANSLVLETAHTVSGMDVDSHMESAPAMTENNHIEHTHVASVFTQPSTHTTADGDSPMGNTDSTAVTLTATEQPTTTTGTEDRLDAVIAGTETHEVGYESSDLESSDDGEGGP